MKLRFHRSAISYCLRPFLAVALSLSVYADEPPLPTDITSTSLVMWSTDTETFAHFTGNVVATGTDLRITCDKLEVTAAGQNEKSATVGKLDKFKYLLATGRVRIIQGDREATCGRAEVFPREERVVLTEKPVVIDHGNSSVAMGEKLTLLRGERRVLGDNVKISFPPMKDLGFDKNQPAPRPETPPADATPAKPAVTPAAPPTTSTGPAPTPSAKPNNAK
jgi:lipopolysaccharide export system protein LptA